MCVSEISFWGSEHVQQLVGVHIQFVVTVVLSWLVKYSYESTPSSNPQPYQIGGHLNLTLLLFGPVVE